MNLEQVLYTNYLPYAKEVIVDRALPSIDGLKPSQRRILYTMYGMRLINGDKVKSTKIVGATMSLHPHGDATVYDTLVRLTTGNETLNVPYIESKGNFGKVYSRDMAYAASRYTEAKLAPICSEVFDGIDEDAVDMVDNFDGTLKEPTVLPVNFPTILCNPSSGIAVGTGSSIPSFGLKNVCGAVIGICDGSIKTTTDLVNVLGIPEFTTGGHVHVTREGIEQIVKTGHGSITMTGKALLYSDRIEIVEIPFKTCVENIIESVEKGIKSGEFREIMSISDDIDLKNGLKLTVYLKRGANPRAVLNKLIYRTPFGTSVAFNVRVIIDGRCETLGIDGLLDRWIDFRMNTIKRIHEYRYNKNLVKIHDLESWEKIKLDIRTVARLIADKNEAEAKQSLMAGYKLDEGQADYLLDMRIKEFTQDRLAKHLAELSNERKDRDYNKLVVDSDNEKKKIIIEDQRRIIEKYKSVENRTHIAAPLAPEEETKEVVPVDDSTVLVVVSKNGYLKRLTTVAEMTSYELPEDEEEWYRFSMKNTEDLLIWCFDGTVYKIAANDIDAGRGKLRDKIDEILGINMPDIMMICASGRYDTYFNVVYNNGKGMRVDLAVASGKRKKYRSVYPATENGTAMVTTSDEFFIVTYKRKAAYINLKILSYNNRAAFKVARVGSGDAVFGIIPASDVPDINSIDLNKYSKDYTVSILEDELWPGAREKYLEVLAKKEAEREAAREAARIEKERLKEAKKAAKRAKRMHQTQA